MSDKASASSMSGSFALFALSKKMLSLSLRTSYSFPPYFFLSSLYVFSIRSMGFVERLSPPPPVGKKGSTGGTEGGTGSKGGGGVGSPCHPYGGLLKW